MKNNVTNLKKLAKQFHALSNPKRLEILSALVSKEQEKPCVHQLAKINAMDQSTVSRHLQALSASGFVEYQEAPVRRHYYHVDKDHIKEALQEMLAFLECS